MNNKKHKFTWYIGYGLGYVIGFIFGYFKLSPWIWDKIEKLKQRKES